MKSAANQGGAGPAHAARAGFKPRDVEEPIDWYYHRPLAALLVAAVRDTPVTPNQITYASGALSLASGLAIGAGAWAGRGWAAAGGLLLLASIVLDCADGQLARLRGVSSPVGRILDGVMDAVAPFAVFHGMAFYLWAAGDRFAVVWSAGVAAAASLVWHASVYDAEKNLYLHASRPDFSLGGSTLLLPDDLRRFQAEFEARGERWHALLMKVWVVWTKPQLGALAPWTLPERRPDNEAERALFVEIFRPPMRVLAWLGFGSHLFLLTVAALVAPLEPRAIWVAWLTMLVPMNVACAWVVATRPGRVRRYLARLAAMRA
jgi:phosphatidylglycerophosphate synthase